MKSKEELLDAIRRDKLGYKIERVYYDDVVDPEFIKKLREKLDVSQLVFSTIIGVRLETVEKWETNFITIPPTAKTLIYLLDQHPEIVRSLYNRDRDLPPVNPIPEISAEAFENWEHVEKPAYSSANEAFPEIPLQPRTYGFIRTRERVMNELVELEKMSLEVDTHLSPRTLQREIRARKKYLNDRTTYRLYQKQLVERELDNRK